MALRALKDAQQAQLCLDHNGTLEIKLRFAAATRSSARSSELFSHFFLFPLLADDLLDEADDAPPSTAHDAAADGDAEVWNSSAM